MSARGTGRARSQSSSAIRASAAPRRSFPQAGRRQSPIPKAKRDYDAVEIALDRRLSGRWSANVSYTWSRLRGNYAGLAQSDEDGRVAPNIGLDFDIRSGHSTSGAHLSTASRDGSDTPDKAHVLFDWPVGTSVGVRWFGASGIRGPAKPRSFRASLSCTRGATATDVCRF